MRCSGPAEIAAKFKYKLDFVNKDDMESVSLMYLTRRADENLREVCRSGSCGKLRYDMLSQLRDGESYLNLKVQIIKVGN